MLPKDYLEWIMVTISLWIDIIAPMYWWKQFDTYRVGVSKQSESTMHTVLITKLKDEHFEGGLEALYLKYLNMLRERGDFETLIRSLPQSFIQRRIVHMNYKSLRNMYFQRKNHKLPEWRKFLDCMLAQIDYPEYITKDNRRIEKEDC